MGMIMILLIFYDILARLKSQAWEEITGEMGNRRSSFLRSLFPMDQISSTKSYLSDNFQQSLFRIIYPPFSHLFSLQSTDYCVTLLLPCSITPHMFDCDGQNKKIAMINCKKQSPHYNHYMRGIDFYNNKETQCHSFRQSVSLLVNELIRNSLSGDSSHPHIYRDRFSTKNKVRSTMSSDMIEYIRQEFEHQCREKDKAAISHLKTTLTELEKKISRAKKQLNTYKNIISQEESEEDNERACEAISTPTCFQEKSTTITSSLSKLIKTQLDYSTLHKIKTYYLSHLTSALEGKDNRALEHLNLSHKVLRNYYRVNSPSFADIEEKKVNLCRARADLNKKTLILDIDETIIHCEEDPNKPYDIALPIQIENGSTAQAYITIRPYAISFLKRMSKYYEIFAFTASHQSYADVVLDQLDPEREYIKHRLYRKNCIEIHENIYAKDLRIINRDLSSMVLVDNAPYSYIFQLENGIPILPYYNGEDKELIQLEKYLQAMAKCQDVREFNKKTFQFHKYCNFTQVEDLIMELYLKDA